MFNVGDKIKIERARRLRRDGEPDRRFKPLMQIDNFMITALAVTELNATPIPPYGEFTFEFRNPS